MTITEAIFNKAIHCLIKEDIENHFSKEQGETDISEYKSYVDYNNQQGTKNSRDKEKLSDIIKTICAFLNSEGGVLIWGAPIPTDNGNKEKVCKGDLTPVSVKIERDQFINRIASEISPTPLRINFQPIDLGNDTYCYVFETSKSDFAPHQYKGTYYMRMDGSTRPAPHQYVEALMKKITLPKLYAQVLLSTAIELPKYAIIPLIVCIRNLSKYIHDKNVTYAINVDGADLISCDCTSIPTIGFEKVITSEAKKVLHYKMPFVENFFVIRDRDKNYGKQLSIQLSVWGDLSPVITSQYNGHFNSGILGVRYDTLEANENRYLYDDDDENTLSKKRVLM